MKKKNFDETCRQNLPIDTKDDPLYFEKLRNDLRWQLRSTELELHKARESGATIEQILNIIESSLLR